MEVNVTIETNAVSGEAIAVQVGNAPLETGVGVRQGPRGLSAYEVATGQGFEGDEDEWLASLKVTSTHIELGTPDCPVTINPRQGSTGYPYNRSVGVANMALLNTLFTNLGTNGVKQARIHSPAGQLHAVGKLAMPRNVAGVIYGDGGRGITINNTREVSLALSEWFVERADDDVGDAWCPAIGMQTLGPVFEDILVRSRVVVNNAYIGVEPSHLFYCATTSISSGQPGHFPGFVADSGVGTGKVHFDRMTFHHGPETSILSLGHPDSPTANNADTPTFSDCHFNGNGPLIDSYTEQALVFTFLDCDYLPQYEGEDVWPTLVRLYRGGTVHFIRGTFLHPMKCVWVGPNGGSGKMMRFEGCKIDNNVFKTDPAGGATGVPGHFMFVDGGDATALQPIRVNLRDIEFTNVAVPTNVAIPVSGNAVSTANPGMVVLTANQKLLVEGCWGVQKNLFATHNINRSNAYGFANRDYYPDITVRDCDIRGSLDANELRVSGSPGAKYNFRCHDCMDEINRPITPIELLEL